jgi:UDP:flavonoid glycosyltransferase YjiC (YdhE family)
MLFVWNPTHTALKYSCPSLIIPHIFNQFFWDKINSKLNLGPSAISIKKLIEVNFESKLLALMNNDSYKINTQRLGGNMRTESDKDKLYELIVN